MHDRVTHPKASKTVKDVIQDLNIWEDELAEYYRCGGEHLTELTKLRTAHKMLPDSTPSSVRLSVKNCVSYDTFKKELRTTLRYLEDYGGMKGATAHMVEQPMRAAESTDYEITQAATAEEGEVDVVALIATLIRGGCDDEMVLAAVQRMQRNGPRARTSPTRPRASTPLRDPKDNKCANCNEKGHDASKCPKTKVMMTERKCHTCNRTGHLARNCPDKDKKGNTGGQARIAAHDGPMRAMMVAEDDGYTLVTRRPIPRGTLISELPVRPNAGNQASRRSRFAPLLCSGYSSVDCVES